MSKRKLLLADDSITIQKVVNLTFADEGIEVITAGDGDTAMKKFVETMPDLVMADVNMPGVDGYRICEMIKQDEETRKIPVILLVGSFEPFDEEEAHRVGADDFLTKPFQSIRQLVHKVSTLLDSTNDVDTLSNEEFPVITDEFIENKPVGSNLTEINQTLGDAGMDDEMIQTNQIGSLSVDEAQKFIFDPDNKPAEKDFAPPPNSSFRNLADYEMPGEVSAQTQPLSLLELNEINHNSSAAKSLEFGNEVFEPANEKGFANRENFEENRGETSGAKDSPEFSESVINGTEGNQSFSTPNYIPENEFTPTNKSHESVSSPANSQTFSPGDSASILNFDDANLLDLPMPERKSPINVQSESSAKREINETGQNAKKTDETSRTKNYPPELVEAIAGKVAEKITDKAIKEIAVELAPQIAALIVKKMTQEKTKE